MLLMSSLCMAQPGPAQACRCTGALASVRACEILRMAASVKPSSTPSVAMSACCCRIMLCSGSVRIRKKSFALRSNTGIRHLSMQDLHQLLNNRVRGLTVNGEFH